MIANDHELIIHCTGITCIDEGMRSVETCPHRLRGQVCQTLIRQLKRQLAFKPTFNQVVHRFESCRYPVTIITSLLGFRLLQRISAGWLKRIGRLN